MPATLSGRYRLVVELGRGGMGVVWEAYDELLHRSVAVKEVHYPAGMLATDRARLAAQTLREARAVAAVDTSTAVRVYDVIDQEGKPWLVMELVRGGTLTDTIRARGPLPSHEVATVGLAVLTALETAHQAGVLHRDVKPSNVLIGDGGRIAPTDFGIATVDSDPGETTSGMLVGSPSYISPERATAPSRLRPPTAGPSARRSGLRRRAGLPTTGKPPLRYSARWPTMSLRRAPTATTTCARCCRR